MSVDGDAGDGVPGDGVVLVVANRTLQGLALERALLERSGGRAVRFHVVVPATPLDDQLADLLASEHVARHGEDGGFVIARRRLADAERHFNSLGLEATGEVGDPDPCTAVLDACRSQQVVREVIVSTLARGRSRWLRDGLPRRLRRELDVPIEVVEAPRVRQRRLAAR